MNRIFLLLLVILLACKTTPEWEGVWRAKWETDPAGYPGTQGITDFTMQGLVTFDGDSITIEGYGFEGCIFSADTIRHTMRWRATKDSLLLYNQDKSPGMSYSIQERTNDLIRLQLIDDIFLTLNK